VTVTDHLHSSNDYNPAGRSSGDSYSKGVRVSPSGDLFDSNNNGSNAATNDKVFKMHYRGFPKEAESEKGTRGFGSSGMGEEKEYKLGMGKIKYSNIPKGSILIPFLSFLVSHPDFSLFSSSHQKER